MVTKLFDKAKKNKADEFYTQMSDIDDELRHYKEQFRDKVVFCNCDDPYESNFFKYFALDFKILGLKKLIATCYIGSPIANTQMSLFDHETPENKTTRVPHKIIINEALDENNDGAFDLQDIVISLAKNKNNTLTRLEGDGDFRSPECVELLKESDIVVTNPPFSLFREYVAQLMEYDKKFIILGNVNAITYKETFKLISENKLWLGQSIHSGDREFRVPDYYPLQAAGFRVDEKGIKYIRVKGVRWFTNIDNKARHEELKSYRTYSPEAYPHYDNYDAIEVSKTIDIPVDWSGLMCVPITFLDKYNPAQFEILGITDRQNSSGLRTKKYTVEDSPKYNDLNARGVIKVNGELKSMYARIIIRRKA